MNTCNQGLFRYQAKGHLRGPATIAEKACTVSHALALALAARKLGQNNVEEQFLVPMANYCYLPNYTGQWRGT